MPEKVHEHTHHTWPNSGTLDQILTLSAGRTIIWDFDGTLADNEVLSRRSFLTQMAGRGHHLPDGFFEQLIGRQDPEIWALLASEFGAPVRDDIDQEMAENRAIYVADALANLEPGWFAQMMIPAFAHAGARQVLLSNGFFDVNAQLIKKWGFNQLEQIRKPDGGKHLLFPELEPTVVIDDHPKYLQLGRDLGAFTVGVRHTLSWAELDADTTVSIAASHN